MGLGVIGDFGNQKSIRDIPVSFHLYVMRLRSYNLLRF